MMKGYEQRHALRQAKRQRIKQERTEKAKAEKEATRRQYVAMKRQLQAAAQAATEQQDEAGQVSAEKADEYVVQMMSAEEKVRLKKLEQAVSAFQEKQTCLGAVAKRPVLAAVRVVHGLRFACMNLSL